MKSNNLVVDFEQHIATITLNRPHKLNALSKELLLELEECLESLRANRRKMRGALLIGAGGRAFSAGGDVKEMLDMNERKGKALSKLAQKITLMIEQLDIPVIACVDGFALGGGCELAMACDFIYATKQSSFGQPETKIGMIPGFGGCVRLTRLLGPAKSKELIYTGKSLGANEALKIGLINQVFGSRNDLLNGAKDALNRVSQCSPNAVSLAKKVLGSIEGMSIEGALARENDAYATVFEGQEKEEGKRAFLGKRAACF